MSCDVKAVYINRDVHSEIAKHLSYQDLLRYRQVSAEVRQAVDFQLCQIDNFKFFHKAVRNNDVTAMRCCFDAFTGHRKLKSV